MADLKRQKDDLIKIAHGLHQEAFDANAYFLIMEQYKKFRKKYKEMVGLWDSALRPKPVAVGAARPLLPNASAWLLAGNDGWMLSPSRCHGRGDAPSTGCHFPAGSHGNAAAPVLALPS